MPTTDDEIETITISLDSNDYITATDYVGVGNMNIIGDLTVCSSTISTPTWQWTEPSNEIVIGNNEDKQKIYIVEPWQSRKPIKVKDGLWVSLEQDLISNDEIKKQILEKIEDEHPDLAIKMGLNPDNIKLVKSEVNLEINKEFR